MDVAASLELLQKKAAEDEQLRKQFWDTRKSQNPLSDFCRICREQGRRFMKWICFRRGRSFMRP